jgi:hypothetical protein
VLRLSSHAAPTQACQAVDALVRRHVAQVFPELSQWISEPPASKA